MIGDQWLVRWCGSRRSGIRCDDAAAGGGRVADAVAYGRGVTNVDAVEGEG